MRSLWAVALVTVVLGTMATETFGQSPSGPQTMSRRDASLYVDGEWRNISDFARWPSTPQERTIVGMCKENIGRCAMNSQGDDGHTLQQCFGLTAPCPIPKTVPVDCGTWGVFKVKKVDVCTCCRRKAILIKGVVVDSTEATIKLKDMLVYTRRQVRVSRTQANGAFNMTFHPTTSTAVILVRDPSGTYIRTVKVVDIPKGSNGPISVTIAMVKRATPIEIDASAENTLSISSNPSDAAAGTAAIKISADTFRRINGSVYSGKVQVSLNFVNTTHSSVEAEIPGVFLTLRSQPLMTDGIFQLTYRATDGTPLRAKPLLVIVRYDLRLWSLSYTNGRWMPLPDRRTSTRRQKSPSEFLVLINDDQWFNIGRIPIAPKCYYKIRVYQEFDGTEIINSTTATFRPGLVATHSTALSQCLRLYAEPTSSPPAKCFEARCPTNVADQLVGLISLTSYEDVLVGGVNVLVVQKLRAKNLSLHTTTIQTEHQGIQYERTPSSEEVSVIFTSSETGPFFTDQTTCDKSDDSKPAFHFLKPDLPSYLPYPDEVDKCTARVWFEGGSDFVTAVTGYGAPIVIAAVSAWSQWTNETESNYFIEITKVHIDIDIPMVLGNNGTTVPLFECVGEGHNSTQAVEGSFDAEVGVGSGSDYWGSSSNNCDSRSKTEQFAHVFECHIRES